MKLNNFSFVVTLVLTFLKVILSYNHIYNSTGISPLHRFTMSTDLLFVGGEGGIVALNKSNLAEIYLEQKFGSNWLLVYYRQTHTVIQCSELNDTSQCQKLDTTLSSLANKSVLSIKNKQNSPVYVLTTVLQENADVIVIGATLISIGEISKKYGIVTLDLTNLTIFDNKEPESNNGPMNLEIGPPFDGHSNLKSGSSFYIVFKSIIPTENFIFFFFQLFKRGSKEFRKSSVGKLCKQSGNDVKSDAYRHSYEDIGLTCRVGNAVFKSVERAVLVNNKSFIVIFRNGSKNAVCTLSTESIINQIISARQDKLRCNNTEYGEYFRPKLAVDSTQCIKNDGNCTGGDVFCTSADGSFCHSKKYSTFWNGKELETTNYIYNSTCNDQLTTIAVQEGPNQTDFIMFLGFADGYIKMVYVEAIDDEKFKIRHEKTVKVTSSRIIDILIEDQLGIFVLSKNQVIKKLYMTNCSDYESCYSCHNTLNHECSWNVFNESCEVYENISGMILPFEKCFGFHSEKRRLIETVEDSGIQFNKPSSMSGALICGFDQASNFSWITDNTTSACLLKNGTNLSPGNYTLTLGLNGTIVAIIELNLIMCWNLNSSNEGLDYHCGWNCSAEQCVGLDYDVETPMNWPTIDKKYKVLKQIYYRNQPIEVGINWLEKSMIGHLMCETSNGTSAEKSTATVNESNCSVICNFIALDSDIQQNRNNTLQLLYKEKYLNESVKLEVFTCRSNLRYNQGCTECGRQQYPVDCHWCSDRRLCYSPDYEQNVCNSTENPCQIFLYQVVPSTGPVNGGTSVIMYGQNFEDSMSVSFGITECNVTNIYKDIHKFDRLECTTLGVDKAQVINNITIRVNETRFPQYNEANQWFEFKSPKMFNFYPNRSIKSGGRSINIRGHYIGYYGPDRYQIYFCNDTSTFVECRNVTTVNNTVINCISGNISKHDMVLNRLKVVIDNNTILQINQSLTYVKDPSGFELSNKTASVQQSGGAKITINGEGFYEVGKVTIDRVAKQCEVDSDILVECETPEYSGSSNLTDKDKVSETVNVYFDGLAVPITIDYVRDPLFEKYKDVVEFEKGAAIEIKGRNIIAGARWNDYTIYIGKTGLCYTEKNYVTDTYIKCWPPQYVPLTNYTDQSLVFVHVKVGRLLEHIGVLKYVKETNNLVVVISVLAAALGIAIVVGVAATLRMRKKRKKDEKKFVFELQSVEERVRTNSREEFAETQIAIGDIQSDLVTSKVPYRDYQTYILLQLFPNQDPTTNSLLPHFQLANGSDTKHTEALENLELLLQNKLFLKSIVQTLDKRNTLTVQEKAQFAALLSIALLGNMRLFYDLVHSLLADSIRSATKRQQRGLLRRLDSITCRMMTNWLQIVLFKQLRGQYGIQLFMLLKAAQTVVERGPVDAVTGHCKNTLCEEKLLKLRVDSEQYILNIDLNGNPDHCFQVKVLECDTISQVKRKCCTQIYKNKPASEIPKFEELLLEWKEGHGGRLLLQDVDQTSERSDVHVRLNTLSHYKVGNECRMALLYGIQKDDNNVNLTGQNNSVSFEDVNPLMPFDDEREDNLQKSHLSTSHVEDGENIERDIGDIYLNRLFHTKLLLSKYIDPMFEGLLDSKCVSLPISYFIQNLDELGRKNAVDPEVLQIWKNECYATRIWAPLIGKPQAAFDIHVPGHIEPIMDVLSQVFVECLTQKTFRVNKESPTQRLLFHKDIERYRKSIPMFYNNLEPVAGHDFWRTLDELSDMQQEDVKFSRHSIIHQLYNLFISKYKDKILNDFEDMEESSGLQFGRKLEEIFELMEEL